MRKSRYNSKTKISPYEPIIIRKRRIGVYDFAEVTTQFLEENFTGLMIVSHNVPRSFNFIRISDEHIVCFFRDLLNYATDDVPLHIDMSLNGMDFCISVDAYGSLPLPFSDINDLIRRAKDAGFDAWVDDDKLILSIETQIFTRPVVRAISTDMLLGSYRYIFFGPRQDS